MDYIREVDFSHVAVLPEIVGAVRTRGALTLAANVTEAIVVSPPISPRMAAAYFGFELIGENLEAVQVAVEAADGTAYFQFAAGAWGVTGAPVYQTAAELRSRITQWLGPLRLRLRLRPTDSGLSPLVRGLKVGYRVLGDLFAYALRYGLAPIVEALDATLVRFQLPQGDGRTFALPGDLDAERVTAGQVLVPETALLPGQVAQGGVSVAEAVPAQPCQLHLTYRLPVDVVTGIFQISQVPGVLLVPGTISQSARPMQAAHIRQTETLSRVVQATVQYLQQVRVTVLARSLEDGRSLTMQIHRALQGLGGIYAPAFDLTVPMQVGPPDQPQQGDDNLFQSGFSLRLWHFWSETTSDEVPTLTEYIHDYQPKEAT